MKQVIRDFVAGKSLENLGEFTKLARDELNKIYFVEKRDQEKYLSLKLESDYLNIISPFFGMNVFHFTAETFLPTFQEQLSNPVRNSKSFWSPLRLEVRATWI